ncbi:cytochrome c peroxidase [Komagataeibacter oboediens]|uniref:cytochrome c peroxidase n=1 Tax=Komagataeibacter oboediens TaxID=65958 RepID=UPI002685D296|nr:cytochrome c peroxidase [Komagataeibacter oboediens]
MIRIARVYSKHSACHSDQRPLRRLSRYFGVDKMRTLFRKVLQMALLGGGALLLSAATRPATWHWDIPSWAPAPVVPSDNPMTAEKVTLGRRLFYDKRLSENGTLACASCHLQKLGFASGVPTHIGAHGEQGLRTPMPLANVAYLPSYTWANPQLTTRNHPARDAGVFRRRWYCGPAGGLSSARAGVHGGVDWECH